MNHEKWKCPDPELDLVNDCTQLWQHMKLYHVPLHCLISRVLWLSNRQATNGNHQCDTQPPSKPRVQKVPGLGTDHNVDINLSINLCHPLPLHSGQSSRLVWLEFDPPSSSYEWTMPFTYRWPTVFPSKFAIYSLRLETMTKMDFVCNAVLIGSSLF